MTPQERKVMELALEALEYIRNIETDVASQTKYGQAAEAIKEALAKPEQKQVPVKWINDTINIVIEQVASWLESECDEQYLADRVRAGDYVKEKGCTENRAALADNCLDHLPPSLVGVGENDYTAQTQQEPIAYFNPQIKGGFYWAKPTKITAPITVSVEPMPLYTEPPQRTWVGLTLTQVKLLWEGVQEEAVKSGDSLNWVFYTHINEALKGKNT